MMQDHRQAYRAPLICDLYKKEKSEKIEIIYFCEIYRGIFDKM